jgi:signal transduction histidine kinase
MKPKTDRKLNKRLWQAFIVQIVLISATVIAGVYLAEFAIREILIVSALEREAEYFWARNRIERDTPAPNTHTLIGYVFEQDSEYTIPEEFRRLPTGIHDLATPVGKSVVHVSHSDGQWLYLVFDANNVRQLAAYFGVAPLALMLIVLYCSAWFAYRLSRRAVSPVTKLARNVRDLDLEAPDAGVFDPARQPKGADDEVLILSHALHQLTDRINKFVERERNFTREASHELRSPLTVIKMASNVLLGKPNLDQANRASVERISRAAQDMEELTRVFLLLARESEGGLARETVSVNEIVKTEIGRCELVYSEKDIDMRLVETGELTTESSPKILSVVLGNLIRNALNYTDHGRIEITIGDGSVTVEDSGIGVSEGQIDAVFRPYFRASNARESGHGIGLSLVKRLTDRFDWPVEFTSEPGRGTHVEVSFPKSRFLAHPSALEHSA